MAQFQVAELVEAAKAYIAADAKRMSERPEGYPRGAWREANPISLPISWLVRDLKFKSKPQRRLNFDLTGNPYDLWVWSCDERRVVIEHIDLQSSTAGDSLARYERV